MIIHHPIYFPMKHWLTTSFPVSPETGTGSHGASHHQSNGRTCGRETRLCGEFEACCGEIRRLIEIWVDRWISAYFGYCVFSIFSFYWCNWQVSEVRPSKLRFLLYFRGLKAHLRRSKSTFWVENAGLLKYMLPLMTSERPGHPRIIFILEKELHKLFTIYIVWSIIYGTCFLCFSIKLLFQNFCCHSSQPPRDPIHLAKVGEPTHLPGEVMAGLLE